MFNPLKLIYKNINYPTMILSKLQLSFLVIIMNFNDETNSYRDSGFLEVKFECHGFSHEDIRIMTRLENSFQFFKLPLRKIRSRSAPFCIVTVRICNVIKVNVITHLLYSSFFKYHLIVFVIKK